MGVNKYRVYCNDESVFVEGYSDSVPTTCFNNNTHIIDNTQTTVVETIETGVRIIQNQPSTNVDKYFLITMTDYVEPNEVKELVTTFKIDMNLFRVIMHSNKANIGDTYDTFLNKNTLVAGVTQADTDTNVIHISDTTHTNTGLFVSFNQTDQYRILSSTTDTITIDGTVTVTTDDKVYVTYYMVKDKYVMRSGTEEFGTAIIGSYKIPAGYTGGITYRNSSTIRKVVHMELETTFA